MGSSAECRWWCCCQQGLKPAILQTRLVQGWKSLSKWVIVVYRVVKARGDAVWRNGVRRSCSQHQPTSPLSAVDRSQDSDDVLVLVDSEDDDDDEGNGEEDTRGSSTKHEVMALVNGNSIQAAYLNCPTEGEPCLPPCWLGLGAGATKGGKNCSLARWLLLRCCSVPRVGDEGEQPSGVPLQRTSGEDARGT